MLRLIEPLIAFRNRRRLAFAAKKMRPIIEERQAIIEHNMKNKEHQMNAPVRCNINQSPLTISCIFRPSTNLSLGNRRTCFKTSWRKPQN